MPQSMSFTGNVTAFSGARKHIEIPKADREFVPFGRYQITISHLGTIQGARATE